MRMWQGLTVAIATAALTATPIANADNPTPSLPQFVPHQSDWQPNTAIYPYNLWQNRVTPEQVTAMRDSCQWFNAQYGPLMSQVFGFQHFLDSQHDNWQAPGVQQAANTVEANLDQSAAFLDPPAPTHSSSSTIPTRASIRLSTTGIRCSTSGISSPRSATT